MRLLLLLGISALWIGSTEQSDANGVKFSVVKVNNETVEISVFRFNQVVQQVRLGENFGVSMVIANQTNGFMVSGNGMSVVVQTIVETSSEALIRVSRTASQSEVRKDCFNLHTDTMSWFGGAQQRLQHWPIEKVSYSNYSYITKENQNFAITERYWLNSRGSYIYVDKEVPLFLDQNQNENRLCLIAQRQLPYDTHTPGSFVFNYYIGVNTNARLAHMSAVSRFLNKPTGYPAEQMVRYPVWSTWAKYKKEINDTVVQTFADEINSNGFDNSQFEIDDEWEDCYGALTFRASKFPDISATIALLKTKQFKNVTLWVHPFISINCSPIYNEALNAGYLVLDHNGSPYTQWWNSIERGDSAYIDFTKTAAVNWYITRLKRLQALGIDSFKFDAGETSWSPPDPVLNGSNILHPSLITTAYVRAVATFGELVEVRTGQNTQDLPVFVRMIDKDSQWTYDNGLPTLITTLLQMNMAGYPLVLPDMVGGNGYFGAPSMELFVRWLQANVFMPSIQFSYVPWDYKNSTITELCLTFTALHDQYTSLIMERFALAQSNGDPVNPPIWWVAPNDRIAHLIDDQFLLGETILVAPVVKEGAVARDIYLPAGNWTDGNNGTVWMGPKWLMAYDAPLAILPYFIKV